MVGVPATLRKPRRVDSIRAENEFLKECPSCETQVSSTEVRAGTCPMDSARRSERAGLGDMMVLSPPGMTGAFHRRELWSPARDLRRRRQLDAWVLNGREEYSARKEKRTGVDTGMLAGESGSRGSSQTLGGGHEPWCDK